MDARTTPYFSFADAKTAVAYYQEVFGATDVYRLSPDRKQAEIFGVPAGVDLADITMYGGFKILGLNFSFSDAFGGQTQPSNQVSVMLDINSADATAVQALDDLYAKLMASGKVTVKMPYTQQFWGNKMGTIVDQYGITWMLSCSPWAEQR
ncbi:glyoxalase/bleomycin resistance/extradiol dioxygenase family protein [Levilactobacillus yiduensis]|uniref:glyoxalase/bleomycin resistance/extradiol dioxygenase family protein n=1 Tax=Levilactobacillus yiduensis TaxID=2953880 RepID=UPI000EF34CFE|nr:glyoxalase/bleomycin resistance/extradiol dioxygenase family protein [Levilactobacillus yiduensis]AYM02351.1 glyoxalase/bleomycin resistance/extradiol dioxygenase family protein [Levilactobacillus brevis]